MNSYQFVKYELHEKKELSLLIMCTNIDKASKKSLLAIGLVLNNVIICKNFLEFIVFKEELNLFDNVDDTGNAYFKNTYRKIDSINSKTLLLSVDERKYYFSKPDAKAIIYIWNMIVNMYSCEELLKNIDFLELYYEKFPYGN